MVTKRQQDAFRALLQAQHEWLVTYGWERANDCKHPERVRWRHSRLDHNHALSAWDAVAETRAKPSIGRSMLSKKQRVATDNLDRAEQEWLEAHGWHPAEHDHWAHPQISSKYRLTRRHALIETHDNPRLGWPKEAARGVV